MIFKLKKSPSFKIIFKFLDSIIWVGIKLIPNKFLFYLIKKRDLKKLRIYFKIEKKCFLKEKLFQYLIKQDSKDIQMSSCLSRSILGSMLLNLINVPNKINLGIVKSKSNEKTAHAWLTEIGGDMTTFNKRHNCIKLIDL